MVEGGVAWRRKKVSMNRTRRNKVGSDGGESYRKAPGRESDSSWRGRLTSSVRSKDGRGGDERSFKLAAKTKFGSQLGRRRTLTGKMRARYQELFPTRQRGRFRGYDDRYVSRAARSAPERLEVEVTSRGSSRVGGVGGDAW